MAPRASSLRRRRRRYLGAGTTKSQAVQRLRPPHRKSRPFPQLIGSSSGAHRLTSRGYLGRLGAREGVEDTASLPARFHYTSVERSGFPIWRPTSSPGTRLLTQTDTQVLREQFLFIVERDEARGPEGQGTANPNLPSQESGARGWRTRD